MSTVNPLNGPALLWANVKQVFCERAQAAWHHVCGETTQALTQMPACLMDSLLNPWKWAQDCWDYTVDAAQRSVLFWDTLRQRGDNFVAH